MVEVPHANHVAVNHIAGSWFDPRGEICGWKKSMRKMSRRMVLKMAIEKRMGNPSSYP